MNDELSNAIVHYLGYRSAISPGKNSPKLVQEFGREQATLLEAEIASVIGEMFKIKLDWSTETLESGTKVVRSEMHARHPELSDTALNALAWKFSFDWR